MGDNIFREISRQWEGGILLSKADIFFIESTLGVATPRDLEHILGLDDDPDLETLIERVLFPESSLRMSLEPLLDHNGISEFREREIVNRLHADYPVLMLQHPEADSAMEIKLSPAQIGQFVSRLYLKRSLSEKICQALQDSRPGPEVLSCRVLLRCKKKALPPNGERLLIRFARSAPEGCPEFGSLFGLCLGLISDAPPAAAPERYLLERREQEKNLLRQILLFEEKRDWYGMEYLMMSRFQVPPDSQETVADRLAQMDTIIDDILCLLPQQEVFHRDLGSFGADAGLSDLIRRLS